MQFSQPGMDALYGAVPIGVAYPHQPVKETVGITALTHASSCKGCKVFEVVEHLLPASSEALICC